ncbi:MAG: hypothetical protein M1821_007912 [Bathelium mastoideum]|nr:MAG: hypothetical protein M1821_007912 [Bathelium mastoideum]
MDPRRHSAPYDPNKYSTYPQRDAYDAVDEFTAPTNAGRDGYDPRRSVYRKARDPSQSFTKRSGASAPVGRDTTRSQSDSYDGSAPNQARGYAAPPVEAYESAPRRQRQSQGPDFFVPNTTDPQDQPRPPNGRPAPPAVQRDPRANKPQRTQSRPAPQDYPPPIQTQLNQYGNNSNDYDVSPISPGTNIRNASGGSVSSSSRRRGSVPHRSPLQKLEGKLDDISKEEKRARLEEAEHQAQQRAAAQRINGMTYDNANQAASRQATSNRDPRTFAAGPSQTARIDPREVRNSPEGGRINPVGNGSSQNRGKPSNQRRNGTQDAPPSQARRRDVSLHDTNYAAGLTERTPPSAEQPNEPVVSKRQGRYYGNVGTDVGIAATGEGMQAIGDTSGQPPTQKGSVSGDPARTTSRRLQKKQPEGYRTGQRDPAAMTDAHKQLQTDRIGANSKSSAVAAALRHQEPDPVPREAVKNQSEHAPTYTIPPQTMAGQHAREQVGLHPEDQQFQAQSTSNTQDRHRFSKILHRDVGPVRQYQAPKPLEEWRQAGVARLLGADIDLEESGPRDDRNKAWWEQGGSRRRSSHSYDDQYDGSQEDKDDRATFNPPLYLRCGPLLRYTGMRREQSSRSSRHASGEREIWRGSVMIVTSDAQSSYERTPVLRLFVQPKNILPPPPAQVDELAPEYVDPLAGLPKLSRTGKLVYVKPVEQLNEEVDYSCIEDDRGLFESTKRAQTTNGDGAHNGQSTPTQQRPKHRQRNGEMQGKYREVKAARLHAERGVTFWRFNLEIELGSEQARIAYRINRGPAIGFWVPARGQSMNVMFHSCNGFSLSVDPNHFSGPDPLWRDVLNSHQTRPFHVMIGGGDQIYNDRATRDTALFQDWLTIKNPEHKHSAQFTAEMQDELEDFYLNRYAMWFSQGLFGMANSQIPMINVWDDHDIIDHQSVVSETQMDEPSWILGASPGPYINELSRSIFMFLGRSVAFLGLDCRTERMRDCILSEESYDLAFERCKREIIKGETKHLIVLLGVPIAYPRLNFLENVLTSRAMDPIKAIGRTGMLGGFVNKFDGGVEILDDLDDHWTAKHHKQERNWFVQELQELAAARSVRVTILGGDVHLAAIGQFYSNKKLGIPKDRDHRYMPNIISSAIVNTPPPNVMADVLNRRNKVHHLDEDTDEDMIPMFLHDVDGTNRNNTHLLPRRNWCSLREYEPGSTPPPTPPPASPSLPEAPPPRRTLSLTRKDFAPATLVRRLSGRSQDPPPPLSQEQTRPYSAYAVGSADTMTRSMGGSQRSVTTPVSQPPYQRQDTSERIALAKANARHNENPNPKAAPPEQLQPQPSLRSPYPPPSLNTYAPALARRHSESDDPSSYGEVAGQPTRPTPFHRRLTDPNIASLRGGPNPQPSHVAHEPAFADHVNLEHGLDICLNVENSQRDPAGITTPYRLLVPALWYEGRPDENTARLGKSRIGSVWQRVRHSVAGPGGRRSSVAGDDAEYSDEEELDSPAPPDPGPRQGQLPRQSVPTAPTAPAAPPTGQEPRRQSASYGYPHAVPPSTATNRRASQPPPAPIDTQQPYSPAGPPSQAQQPRPQQQQWQQPAQAQPAPQLHQQQQQQQHLPMHDPRYPPDAASPPLSPATADKPRGPGGFLTGLARRMSRAARGSPKAPRADEGYGRERYGESEEDLPEDERYEDEEGEDESVDEEGYRGEEGEEWSPGGEAKRKPAWKIWR